MNSVYISIFIIFSISTVKGDVLNSSLTLFKGDIGCNSTVSNTILDSINYPYHLWKLDLNNTIQCYSVFHVNLSLSNTNQPQIGYNYLQIISGDGELINNYNSSIIPNQKNNLTYYIQIKTLHKYKFQIICHTKCNKKRSRLLSKSSYSYSSDSSDEQQLTTTATPTTTTTTTTTTTLQQLQRHQQQQLQLQQQLLQQPLQQPLQQLQKHQQQQLLLQQ
eukprot:173678_1